MMDVVSHGLLECGHTETLRTHTLIIGSGVGGSITAWARVKQSPEVLILEEGPDVSEIPAPYSLPKCMDALWREGGIVPIESNARFVFAEGRTVGGSSMVNAGILHRLPEDIRARWESAYGLAAFQEADLEPFYKEAEAMCVALKVDTASPQAERFEQGARALGMSTVNPQTTIGVEADGTLQRKSMRATYLREAVEGGARILTRFQAQRIVFHHGRAVGVRGMHRHPDGSTHSIQILCESLVLCCGAIQTPLLLRRSGVRRGIGDSLRFHPTLRIAAAFPESMTPWKDVMPAVQIKDLAPELSFGMSLSWPSHLASALTPAWPESATRVSELLSLALYYVMTPSHGRGTVRPFWGGGYRAAYSFTHEDMHHLDRGYRVLSDILREAGATHLIPSLRPGRHEAAPLRPRDLFAMSIHAFSSCPMGETAACPVDSFGRLKGYSNVSIQDASLLPEAPTVNPQLTIMATVLRNMAHLSI